MKIKNVLVILLVSLFLAGCMPKNDSVTAVGEGEYGNVEIHYTISDNTLSEKILLKFMGEDELTSIVYEVENPHSLELLNFQGQMGTFEEQTGWMEGKSKRSVDKEELIKIINDAQITVEWKIANGNYTETIYLAAK
ncbi:hypothetical protein [Alkalihalobacterium chitinilyticum]|uniref:Lipoprotein n=1 Tax=Alkalihalobacterium chitinilyticum TaxID=2980103 RepID=A0ABT5VCL7_9BACI|nr:hypothetical protein [Alkalihalobacterium chitinilyticum]MDE5413194.1 hypothetical protein [Alkalihalobacterium chitinilyticum]